MRVVAIDSRDNDSLAQCISHPAPDCASRFAVLLLDSNRGRALS
jgi:hypothetical protein